MTKGDFPALRMTIDGGRLIPAGPFDQERLNSYRRGTVVFVRFTEEKDRVLVRKWWAVLGLVVKQCQTPWKTKEEASEAVKLALGIVNLSKTIGGQFMQYPKSLTELDDPELTEALENMTELLSRMTGVDVATLRKETAHVDEERSDPETGEIIETKSPDSGSPPPEPDTAESETPIAPAASDDTAPKASSSDAPLSQADLDWLATVAKMLWSATHEMDDREEATRILETQKMCVPNGKAMSEAAREIARKIYTQLENTAKFGFPKEPKRKVIANYAGISEKELV